ncbi:hypothetical protein PPGU19_102150 (plasmid) [Paraburkholderia sp. PGU19]|nr:hypothetical protein PPGU19_102150 [Paraburkholderia sp. PGU19]
MGETVARSLRSGRSRCAERNTSVSLGEHFADLVVGPLRPIGSASDVMRAGLRPLETHETQVRALQKR